MCSPDRRPAPIVLVTGAQPPRLCGVGDYTASLAAALRTRGLDTRIQTGLDAFPAPGTEPLVADWDHPVAALTTLARHWRRERPAAVHVQYPGSFGEANRSPAGNLLPGLARAMGIPVVVTLHEYLERSPAWRARALPMALTADRVVAVTASDAAHLDRLPGLRGRVVHAPIAASLVFERVFPTVSPTLRLAYFGFLHPLKGTSELIEAVGLARALGADASLDLFGHFQPDDPHHAALAAHADSTAPGAIRFRGSVPADPAGAAEAFAEVDLAVMPFREGVSERRSSFLTFGWAGFPVLTSPGPWAPSWLRDDENCLLEPLTPRGWAARLARLARERPDLGPLGLALRREVRSRHAWDAIAAIHHRIYGDIA